MANNHVLNIVKQLRDEKSDIERTLTSMEDIALELEKDGESGKVNEVLRSIKSIYDSMIKLDEKSNKLIAKYKLDMNILPTDKLRDEYLKTVKEKVWYINHDEPPPGEDDDIFFGGTETSVAKEDLICPYLGTIMREPMRNYCGHSYSKRGIYSYLDYNMANKRMDYVECPAQGCTAIVKKLDLIPNKALEVQIEIYEKLHPPEEEIDEDIIED